MAVTILVARPAVVADDERAGHRRYRCHVERMALTAPTGAAMLEAGAMTPHMVRELALRARISPKQAMRWLAEWKDVQEHGEPEKTDRIPPGLLRVIARKKGNVALALRAYYNFDLEKIASVRSSVYRAIKAADLHLLLALKAGEDRWERYLEIGVYEPDHANEVWQIDEMHIPIRCRLPNGQVIENLYLLSIVDAYSGLVLNAQVTIGQSDAVMASAVLARAIAGGTLHGVTYGGSAEALAMDNALIFTSDDILAVLMLADMAAKYARPYTPPDKADVERYHWTLQQMYLMGVTGYLDAPAERRWEPTGEFDKQGRPKRGRVEVPMGNPAYETDNLSDEQEAEVD
jgi:transposase InsO family protein